MSWQIFIAVSIVFNSFSSLVQRSMMKGQKHDGYVFAIVFQLLGAIFVFVTGLILGEIAFPDLSGVLINLMLLLVFYGLGSRFLFESFKRVEASSLTIVFTSRAIVTILAGRIILGEILTMHQLIGIGMILLGVVIVSMKNSKVNFTNGMGYVIVASILFGLGLANDKYILNEIEISTFSFMTLGFFLPAVLMLAISPKSLLKMDIFFERKTLVNMVVFTMLYVVQAITFFMAVQEVDVSMVASLKQLSTVLTVVLAVLLLRERDYLLRKLVGVVISFAGLLLI
jgi:drug/metabolite transporter (DMT)-like permease